MNSVYLIPASVFLGILILVRIARYKKSGELQGIYNLRTICICNIIVTVLAIADLIYSAFTRKTLNLIVLINPRSFNTVIIALVISSLLLTFCVIVSIKGLSLHKKLSGKDGPLNELTKIKQQQPIADAHKVRCPSCLKLTVDTAKFCHHCGYNRETQSLIARCPSCQNPIVDDAKFCHHCGYEIDMTDNN